MTDPDAPFHIKWAWDLGLDPGSPFSGRVNSGGRGEATPDHLITLRGMNEAVTILAPTRWMRQEDPTLWYVFCRNFWNVVRELWPVEFDDPKSHKLQTIPGQRGLARFGQQILRGVLASQDMSEALIRSAFSNDGSRVNWRREGIFREATGKAGQRIVYEELIRRYGNPLTGRSP